MPPRCWTLAWRDERDGLTIHQYRALNDKLRLMLDDVNRWVKRMTKQLFPHDDELLQLVLAVAECQQVSLLDTARAAAREQSKNTAKTNGDDRS